VDGDHPGGRPATGPDRARAARRRAAALCAEAADARRRSDEVANRLVDTLLLAPADALGVRRAGFSLRAGRLRPTIRLVREVLRCWLEAAGVAADVVSEVVLACSEACANAVEHPTDPARRAFEVEARRQGARIELLVQDFGRWDEAQRVTTRGRGLALMRSLMDSVEIGQTRTGTQVAMRRTLA
jgi:anti-sigma regulatory factor (Ser/Thr protein kinase)